MWRDSEASVRLLPQLFDTLLASVPEVGMELQEMSREAELLESLPTVTEEDGLSGQLYADLQTKYDKLGSFIRRAGDKVESFGVNQLRLMLKVNDKVSNALNFHRKVQNKKEFFAHARTLSKSIPIGYTREYISAWKDWQFGEGNFLDCIDLLEKQAEVCDIEDYKMAIALLKGEEHGSVHTLRIFSNSSSHVDAGRFTDVMQGLTEHEKGWLSLILLFSNPSEQVFRLVKKPIFY